MKTRLIDANSNGIFELDPAAIVTREPLCDYSPEHNPSAYCDAVRITLSNGAVVVVTVFAEPGHSPMAILDGFEAMISRNGDDLRRIEK